MTKGRQTRAGLILILTRRRLGGRGNSPTGPRRVVALVENARRSVMKRSQSATTACAATLSAQVMRTRSHGQKKALRRHHLHCRPKSACLLLLLRFQLTTQDAMYAIGSTYHIVNQHRSRTRSPLAATVCDPDLSALMNRNANPRKFKLVCYPVHPLTCSPPGRQTVGPRPGLNHRDTSQNILPLLRLRSVSTILVCTIIRHRP